LIGLKKRAILTGFASVLVTGLVVLALGQRPIDHRALERVAAAERERARQQLKTDKPEDAEDSGRRALEALDKLLALRPNDREFRRGQAEVLEIMAAAQAAQGRPDEAALAYRQAVPLWADLVAEQPHGIDDRLRMADCLDHYGLLLVDAGRWTEAEYVFARGQALCEKIPNALKSEPQIRRDLVLFLSRLARLTLDMGRRSDSLENFTKAASAQRTLADVPAGRPQDRESLVAILVDQAEALAELKCPVEAERSLAEARGITQRLMDSDPDEPRYQSLAASVFYRFALLIQAASSRVQEARDNFERAMAIQEKLVARPEGGRDYLHDLSATCGSLANLLCTEGLYSQAEALYRKELACRSTLVQEHPEDVSARFAHGRVVHNLADFLRERGRAKEALPLEHEAARELMGVYTTDFRNPEYRRAISYAYWTLCALALDLGDHRAAAKAIEEYQKVEPAGFEEHLESARFLCRCITLSHADHSMKQPEREVLARSYADRAVRALESAVRNGYNDQIDLESAACYEPLRGRDDFARLVREVEARSRFADHD